MLRIAAEHGVHVVGVFGSVARGEDRPDSDIDLLVELPTGMGLLALGRAQQALEDLLGSPVELVPEADLKPGARPAVAADLVRLWVVSIEAVRRHLLRGDLSDGLIFDAVRIRLLETGQVVKAMSPELLATEPSVPWRQIAAMRDQLAHRYFDTSHSLWQPP